MVYGACWVVVLNGWREERTVYRTEFKTYFELGVLSEGVTEELRWTPVTACMTAAQVRDRACWAEHHRSTMLNACNSRHGLSTELGFGLMEAPTGRRAGHLGSLICYQASH